MRLPRSWRKAGQTALGHLTVGMLKVVRHTDPDRMADWLGGAMRRIGPMLPEHRIGRENLVAAFPEKSAEEIDAILSGAWDNLGRLGAEFAHLDHLRTRYPERLEFTPETAARFDRLRDDGKPALIFAAHLANWEMPAVGARLYDLPSTVLFRAPNLKPVADAIRKMRAKSMGDMVQTGLDAPVRLARALERGHHLGILVDQYFSKGVEVTFFGRKCLANPLVALLARQIDCPIHGTRAIRLPGRRFRGELSEEITPVRDSEGKIDVTGTMQAITDVVEGWIREYPEQWLWMHRRWR
ncbi:MAG: lipid A biosynthesis lauroyl acyltransferase [Pseudorhodoplanes sp.]